MPLTNQKMGLRQMRGVENARLLIWVLNGVDRRLATLWAWKDSSPGDLCGRKRKKGRGECRSPFELSEKGELSPCRESRAPARAKQPEPEGSNRCAGQSLR